MKRPHLHMPVRFTAAMLALAMGCASLTGCSDQTMDMPTDSATQSTAQESEAETNTAETTAPEETEPTTTAYISPVETVSAALGTQIDVDVMLNRNNDNTYKAALPQFIGEEDTVYSFTFVFYAGDGVSNIGTYKGGCGISVTADCPVATDEGWYQSDDFSVSAQGSYCEVQWNVPADIQPYIDPNGEVLIGYWWGNTTTVQLKNVICSYVKTAQLPVDATETIPVGQTLNFNNESTKSVRIPLADVLSEDCTPQAITFNINGSGSFGKFTGGFGITTDDWYQSDTIAIFTDSSHLQLTWILPEEVKAAVPADAEVMLGYWWGEAATLTLSDITVKYAYGSGGAPAEKPERTEESTEAAQTSDNNNGEDVTEMTAGNAAKIAADIKVGWVLGNSLDCYNVTKAETGWGNPVTTKSMIDTVKAAGFNAVRIPVSWTDHITEDGTIDAAWMDRVQEVVDYSMDNDLYTILNVHHDDYTWLKPTYAQEAAVKAKLTKIWTQIADRFQDYDGKLLFEGMNEPRIVGSTYEWTGGTAEERDVINHLLQAFVDTIRASGGNNPNRTLIVTTHAASVTTNAVEGLAVPDDGNIIVSIHSYAPWKFCFADHPNDKTFDDNGRNEIAKNIDYLYGTFVQNGIPVIIGEFGAENKDNSADRAAYYSYYISTAKARGIPCFIWDNGSKNSFGLLDRRNCTWYDQSILDGVMAAAN